MDPTFIDAMLTSMSIIRRPFYNCITVIDEAEVLTETYPSRRKNTCFCFF